MVEMLIEPAPRRLRRSRKNTGQMLGEFFADLVDSPDSQEGYAIFSLRSPGKRLAPQKIFFPFFASFRGYFFFFVGTVEALWYTLSPV